MKAVIYIAKTLDKTLDENRQKRLYQFIEKEKLEVEHIYYDVIGFEFKGKRLGLRTLLNDLKTNKIKAEAFVTISIHDVGNNDDFIQIICEINEYIENIYFTELEGA